MKVSIIDGKPIYGVDYSKKGAVVIDISDDDFQKIKEGKSLLLDGVVVDMPIQETPEPTEEELAEIAAKELAQKQEAALLNIKDMLIKKRAMEIVGENTDAIVADITLASEEYIDSTTATKSAKTTLKSSILEKL